jgi:iron(III) transport system substrate-binding protein
MSEEGQEFQIKQLGYLTALKNPPLNPPGYDPKVIKAWVPKFDQYVALRDQWVEEWNKTYGYRQ